MYILNFWKGKNERTSIGSFNFSWSTFSSKSSRRSLLSLTRHSPSTTFLEYLSKSQSSSLMLKCFTLAGAMADRNVSLNNRTSLNFWIRVLNSVSILSTAPENICRWDLYSLMRTYGDMMEEASSTFKSVISKIFMTKLPSNLSYLREKCRVPSGRDEVEVPEPIEPFATWLGDTIYGCKSLSYHKEWKTFIKTCMNLTSFNRIKI